MTRPYARLHTLIWVCLYGGLLPLAMTWFVQDPVLARTLQIICGALISLGVLLWIFRTQRKDPPQE